MKRSILAIAGLVSVGLFACGGTHAPANVAQVPVTSAKSAHVVPFAIEEDVYGKAQPALASTRVPGTFVVREITLAGKKTPIVISERVLSTDGASAILEVSMKDGKQTDTYRVRLEETASGEQTTEVTKMQGTTEHAFGVAAYDALMAKTVPAVDRNDGMVDAEQTTVDVGANKVAAMRTEYKVMMGGKPATMTVFQSKALGDMGGEIAGADGKILYRTRIVEMGSAPVGTASR